MHPLDARAQVFAEITRENRSVRQQYISTFSEEAQAFSDLMGDMLANWLDMHAAEPDNERKMRVLTLAYAAISLHIGSMKLFLSGQQIASGNLMRQAIESIALALLCTNKTLGILDRFDNNEYSTKNAVTDARRNAAALKINKTSLQTLEASQKFYSKFSHPTKMTLGTLDSFAGEGIYLGAAFDTGKDKHYRSEIGNRVKLAKLYPGFLKVVKRNLAAW